MTIFNSFLYVYQRVWFVAYSTLKISWIESPAIVFQAAGCSKSSCLAQGPSHRERNQQRLAVFNSGTSTPNWGETPVTNSFFFERCQFTSMLHALSIVSGSSTAIPATSRPVVATTNWSGNVNDGGCQAWLPGCRWILHVIKSQVHSKNEWFMWFHACHG